MGVQSIKSNPAMISLLVLVASAAGAPQYGPPPPLPPTRPPPVPTPSPSPEKLIAPVTPAVACTVAYVTVWDTEYHDHENEVSETVYEQVCNTELQRLCKPTTREECSTIYKNVCVQKYRTEYDPYTETECTTEYKQDCQYEWRGHGNDKVWAPIEGTCQNVPYDECRDVAKTHAKQVAYQECNDVPEQKCHSEHKRFPVRISRQAPKKVCDEVCDEVHSTAPLAAAAVHQAPVHHQASPSVQDLLNYGVPAVPTQTVPQIIDARDKQKLQSAAKDDRIVFA